MQTDPTKSRFSLVTDAERAREAEDELLARFREAAAWVNPRTLGFPGGSDEFEVSWLPQADLWFAPWEADSRWWHGFGLGEPVEGRNTGIEVEINPPFSGINRRVAGAFLEDAEGRLYLAHSGKVGGGRKGIGKKAFLSSYSGAVVEADGHPYCLVGGLDDEDFIHDVAAFVRHVRNFKASAVVRTASEEDSDDERGPADIFWLFQPGSFASNQREASRSPQPGDVGTWMVTDEVDWMGSGGRIMFWRQGDRPGIYALGTLTGPDVDLDPEDTPVEVPFRYDAVLDEPVSESSIREDEQLAELELFEDERSTNVELEEDDWDRIAELLDERGVSVEPYVSPDVRAMIERLEAWHPDDQVRYAALDLMADAIDRAHEISPRGWSATVDKSGSFNINTGRHAAVAMMPNRRLGISLARDSTPPATWDRIEDASESRYDFAGPPAGTWWALDRPSLTDDLDGARDGVLDFAEGSADAYKTAPTRRHHNQALVAAISHLLGHPLPTPGYPAASVRSFWKISPGSQGHLWSACREGGYIAIGWPELGDLSDVGRGEFDARLEQMLADNPGMKAGGPEQVWKFAQIPVGACIVANAGTRRVVGLGTVVGPYTFVGDDADTDVNGDTFPHRLPVRWDDIEERDVERPGWKRTLIKLSESDFEEILAGPADADADDAEAAETEDALDFDGIVNKLVEGGFHFSEELIATYLLALQTKRFVILSGISGTGKTVLAKEVARALQGSADPDIVPERDGGGWTVTVKPYNLKYPRLTLPAGLVNSNPGFLQAALDNERVELEFPGGRQAVSLNKAPTANTVFVSLSKAAKAWFTESMSEGDALQVSIEPNEAGEPRLVRVVVPTEAQVVAPRRYEVVAVRPDWTDNTGLLGFFNPLQQEYSTTPFLSLVQRAVEEHDRAVREDRPARPYFAILDEMNLARVEHYFSDFLSCMESGEPITLHDDPTAEQDGVARRLRIPPNLFFTGTVNVDESTYMFSPKVLDRAFTLEFNDVDLESYGADADEVEFGDPMQLTRFEGRLQVKKKLQPKEWADFRARSPALAAVVSDLNRILAKTHRHFGYRVANEIGRFMNLAAEQTSHSEDAKWAALDIAIRSKALPKLHGTQQELEPTLTELFGFSVDPSKPAEANHGDWSLEHGMLAPKPAPEASAPLAPRLPRTALKLHRMLGRVRTQGFTSFIE